VSKDIDRWKKVVAGLVAMTACVAYATHAHAAAPVAKTQAPGFYRMMLGDFEVTAISDGVVTLPMGKLLTNATPQRVEQLLKRAYLQDPIPTSVNAFVVNTGSKLVMVDAGAGTLFGPTLNKLVDNLKAAGYQPEQIDEIYITHMHGDHVGGLVSGDRMVFPNAIVRADKRDADFWLSQAKMDAAKEDERPAFKGAMVSLNPYVAAGKFKPFDGATDLVPGVRAVSAYGHTPGHTMYLVESKGQSMLMLGDLLHVAAVQFPDPSVTIQFDTDSKAAAAARKKVYADVAKQGRWIAVAHVSFPGIGHIRQDGTGYIYYPVNYTIP
jgi:glyoxylase-like metal-dependent hydrolase (beta-lactamase superfamily II)